MYVLVLFKFLPALICLSKAETAVRPLILIHVGFRLNYLGDVAEYFILSFQHLLMASHSYGLVVQKN